MSKFLVNTTYDEGLTLIFYDTETQTLKRVSASGKHLPYLWTTPTPALGLSSFIDRIKELAPKYNIVRVEKHIKYDPTIQRTGEYYKAIVKSPTDIYNRFRKDGLRMRLEKTWEDKIPYHLCYCWDEGFVFGAPYDENLKPIYGTTISLKRSEKLLKNRYMEILLKFISAPLFDPKRASVDIEVQNGDLNAREAENSIICASFKFNDKKSLVLGLNPKEMTPLTITSKDNYTLEVYNNEVTFMTRLLSIINEYPFVFTFNGDGYDLLYIYHRAKNLGIAENLIPIIVLEEGERVVECHLKNGIHIDFMRYFGGGILTYVFPGAFFDLSLDGCAKDILKRGKLQFSDWSYFSEEMANYCYNDAELTFDFTTAKEGITLSVLILITRLYNLPIEEVSRKTMMNLNQQLLSYMHRLVGYLIPNSDWFEKRNLELGVAESEHAKYKGAVIEAKRGVHFNVKGLDYRSLYPSKIDLQNLSYETIGICTHEDCPNVPDHNFKVCQKIDGIFSSFVGAVRDIRSYYKGRKKEGPFFDAVAQALKICMLSCYGMWGSDKSKNPLYALASTITAFGRDSILTALKKAEEHNIEVVYSHTDSFFIKEQSEEKTKELVDEVSKAIGVEIDIDKNFRYIVVSARANYLGVEQDGKLEIKGLMGKKRHYPPFLKQTFTNVTSELSKVMVPEEFEGVDERIKNIVFDALEKLKAREFEIKDLTFTLRMNLPLEKGKGQDYEVLRQYHEHGIEKVIGDMYGKVLTLGSYSAKPPEFTRLSEINVKGYTETLEGMLKQILIPLGISFKEIQERKWKKLDAYSRTTKPLELNISRRGLEKWKK